MKNILAALDFSDITPEVIRIAAGQAKGSGAKLWLVHIAAPDPEFVGYEVGPQHVRDGRADTLKAEHSQLHSYAQDLQQQGIEVTSLLVQGPSGSSILDEALRLEADMIIIGSHGHGLLYQALVGSVCQEVLKHSQVPVMIVPASKKS